MHITSKLSELIQNFLKLRHFPRTLSFAWEQRAAPVRVARDIKRSWIQTRSQARHRPATRHPDPDIGACLPLIGVIATAMLVAVAAMGLILIAASIDGQAVRDFIAPTAAQARESGWQQLVEAAR